MKKTFKLHIEGKNPDRLLEAIKHEVRKYVKRERGKTLPKGVDFWAFDCKFGATEATAEVVRLAELTKKMDEVASAGGDSFYVEILAAHGVRKPRAEDDASLDDDEDLND
ncbi:DUF6172 family protein [Cellvibrio sp. NN19]|uniref:DUF6172 family protein n=1 Tax=Cellvibrio chitinivorans TaxID=3102792 RepID=UPI002B40B74B|nr:DUF6172 family protein [Cellvibrio sp. NN19]